MAFSVPVGALNKAANVGFETSPEPGTSWTAGGTTAATEDSFARVTTDFRAGAASFQGRWTGTANNRVVTRYISQPFTPATAAGVAVRGFYKRTGAGAVDAFTFRIAVREGSATGTIRSEFLYANPANATPPTDATWQDSGLTPAFTATGGTTYYVTIEWTTTLDTGESAGALVDDVYLDVSPAGLSAASVTGTTNVSLSWSASAGTPALRGTNPYQVYRGTAPGSTSALAFSSSPTHTDATATGNTTYYFAVTDFDTNGVESTKSNEVSVLTRPGQPSTPIFSAIGTNTLTVTWNAPTGGASSYRLERGADSTGPWTDTFPGATSPYIDSTVSPSTMYWYRVVPANGPGDGVPSASASVMTATATPPPIPGAPGASGQTTMSMNVGWTASTGATSYTLAVYTDAGLTTPLTGSPFTPSPPSTNSLALSNLSPNTLYWMRVSATGPGGTSDWSLTGLGTSVSGPPGAFTFSGTTSSGTNVSWEPPTGTAPISSYTLEVATDGGFGSIIQTHTLVTSSQAISGLSPSTPYYFRARATNGAGVASASSSTGTVTTNPSAQTLLATGADPTQAQPLCPGGEAAYVDQLVFSSDPTADTVNSLAVALGLDAGPAVALVEIRDAGGTALSPPRAEVPAGDTVTFGSALLPSPTAAGATYRLYLTPQIHALTPARSYGVTARVSSFTPASHSPQGTDSASTFTIDNEPLVNATWGPVTPGNNQIELRWTNPPADSGAAVTQIVVLRRKTSSAFTEALEDGTTPPGQGTTTSSGSTVVYSQAGAAGAPVTFVDGSVLNGNTYVYRLYVLDGCGNWNAGAANGPHTPAGTFVAEGSTVVGAPTISIVNPLKGTTLSGTFRVQIRVFNGVAQGGIAGLVDGDGNLIPDSLAYSTDDGTTWRTSGITTLAGFDTATSGTLTGRTYEVQLAPPSAGAYTLRARVSNAVAADVLSNAVSIAFRTTGGAGTLLVRDNSSQLCGDCHAMKSHTSETTSGNRGSWSTTCRDCHTPHGTRNVFLVNETIVPPAVGGPQTGREVVFHSRGDMARGDGKGVCQVCHTRTDYYRRDGSGAAHETGNDCSRCHGHGQGLAATCTGCHGNADRLKNPTILGMVDERLTAAPPKDSDEPANPGNDALRVGAHQAHVNQGTWRDDALLCADCHPATRSHQGVRDAAWSAVATGGGTVTPTPAAATGYDTAWEAAPTCSNYCHGATLTGGSKRTPNWTVGYTAPGTEVTCGACHGRPPALSATPGENHPRNPGCDDCHGVGYEAMGVAAKATHIDLQYQGPARNGCTACHGVLAGPTGPAQPNTNLASAPGWDVTAVTPEGGIDPGAHDAHVRPTSGQGLMTPKSCEVCHVSLPTDKSHANGSVAIGWNPPASSEGVSPGYVGGSCTNYCHSDAKPLGAAGATMVPVAWTASIDFGCTSCHGDGAAGPALSSRHAKHLGAPYAFGCNDCHAATASSNTSIGDASLHVNGARNTAFSSAFKGTIDQHLGQYAGYTCSGTYCHSPGTKTSGFDAPVGISLSWNGGSTSALCDNCHGGSASATQKMGTGSHTAHVNNPALLTKYGCITCHSATVTDDTHLAASAPHVNGAKEVSAASWNGSTCAANSCHADGKGTYVSATWGVDTLGCNGCHGAEGTRHPLGAPNYTNAGVDTLRANSHGKHVGTDPSVCATCHPDTTSDGISLSANHANGAMNVRLTVAGTYTPRSGNTSPSCSGISCHANAKWGGSLTEGPCSSCHLEPAAAGPQDRDDFEYQNGTQAKIDRDDWELTGHGRPSPFDPLAGQSGNAAPNFPVSAGVEGCYYCHAPRDAVPGGSQTSNHGDVNNPFRLANVNWGLKGKNGACLVCHDAASAAGFDPDGGSGVYGPRIASTGARVNATHYGPGHASAGNGKGGELCWDCHDPHGDFNYTTTPNRLIAYMIHERPVRTHELADPNGWGIPQLSPVSEMTASTVDFSGAVSGSTTVFEGTDYTDTGASGPYNGVCQVCHTATAYHLASGAGRDHMTGAQCTRCHAHDQAVATDAFKQATGCGDCHAANPTASGEHAVHVGAAPPIYGDVTPRSTADAYAYGCGKCHATSGATPATHFNSNAGGTTASPYQAEVVFDWASGTPYTPGTASMDPGPTGLVFRTTTGTCATYCHSNGAPLQSTGVNATPTYASIAWDASVSVSCGSCHGYGDAPGTMSAPHAKHIRANASSAYNYACFECHQPTTTALDTVNYKDKHVDGVNDQVAFRSSLNPSGSYATGTFTCSSTYCHSDGQPLGAPAPAYKAPKWTDPAMPGNCTGCHGGNAGTGASAIATNKHGQHINQSNVLGTNYGCVDCHNTTVSGDQAILAPTGYAQHVDGGAKDVGFPARPGGQTSAAYASPSCASNYCHSSGRDPNFGTYAERYTTVAWDGTAIVCSGCHGKGNSAGSPDYPDDASLAGANSHSKHVGTTPSPAKCKDCHSGYVTTDGLAISGSSHTDGFRNVGILSTWDTDTNATNNYAITSKTCSSVKCHTDGKATPTYKSVVWGDNTLACNGCHSNRGIDQGGVAADLSAKHGKHVNGGAGAYVYTCDECHASTMQDNSSTVIANPANHTNGAPANVAFSTTALPASINQSGGGFTGGATGTCSNTYCHSRGTSTTSFVAPYVNVPWNGTATCESCHGGNASATNKMGPSNDHAAHMDQAATYLGKNIMCYRCHATTVSNASDTTLHATTGTTNHVNGTPNVSMVKPDMTSAGTYGGPVTKTCSNVYCHSDGTETPGYKSGMDWDAVPSQSLTNDCRPCHGSAGGAFVSTYGEPNYANVVTVDGDTKNSHLKHVSRTDLTLAKQQCADCHSATINADGTLTTGTTHLNAGVEVTVGGKIGGYDATTEACTSITCHAGKSASWGDTLTCYACHGTSRSKDAGVGGTVDANLSAAPPVDSAGNGIGVGVGAHQKHVNSGTYRYNALVCTDCHPTAGSTHNGTGDAAWSALASTNPRSNYTLYPAAGATAYDATWEASPTCTNWCHGDGLAGGGRGLAWSWTGTGTTCSSCHGQATPAVAMPALATAHHPQNPTCASCHGAGYATSGLSTTTAKQSHIDGTVQKSRTGCTLCHGDLTATGKLHADPLAMPGYNANSADTLGGTAATNAGVGAHDKHLLGTALRTGSAGGTAADCGDCHSIPADDADVGHATGSGTGGARATVTASTFAKTNGATGDYTGSGTAATGGTGNTAGTCSVYCHGGGTKLQGAAYKGSNTTPSWTAGAGAQACGACHLVPPTTSGHPSPYPTTKNCQDCHPGYNYTPAGGLVSLDKTKHINGQLDGGGGPNCTSASCHGAPTTNRRNAVADFADGTSPNFRSHHVGNGGTMGGTLSDNDCWVCHAEYDVAQSSTGALHMNNKIDLRDADNNSAYFQFDTDTIALLGTSGANSGNATWKAETSGQNDDVVNSTNKAACNPTGPGCSKGLDRFCISCHDADGASASRTLGETGATAMNPFYDTTVTNNYDQVDRTRVTDIASRVHETARTGTGGSWASTDRDISSQPPPSPPDRTLDTRKDPPYGVFSRHAIRGLSVSVYGTTNATLDTATYWAKTWARSNTVMGCADCHTIDGVNGTAGNAHGSGSEYLLKDASGGATEGTLAGGTYVCYICHVAANYDSGAAHTTGNAQDFQDYTGSVGANRKPLLVSGGNIYGYACGNCHGGGAPTKAGAALPGGVTVADGGLPNGTATGPIGGFGTIHGTSQVIGIGQNGGAAGSAYRSAYRFMNGNSMRYYDPGNWTSNAVARGCYTLDVTGDQWGGCNKHGAGTAITTRNLTPVMQRPLKY